MRGVTQHVESAPRAPTDRGRCCFAPRKQTTRPRNPGRSGKSRLQYRHGAAEEVFATDKTKGLGMSDELFDLDGWLHRIGYEGPRAPTLITLGAIIATHAAAIPYENIDVLLGRPPKLDVGSLQRKMVAERRGGYCFEQNMLLRAGLSALGFPVTSFVAQVIRGIVAETPRPAHYAGHMVLRVDVQEGQFLADVGFGNLTPTAPLALRPDVEQETPHETMRFILVGENLTLQAKLGDKWENIYRLMPHPRADPDLEVANWFTATHPNSLFVRSLIAARPGQGGTRNTLFNGRFSVRRRSGEVERRILDDDAEYRAVLRDSFGLVLPEPDLKAALEALDRRGARDATHAIFD